ncbi:hypothetical protein ACFFMN_13635 [Planobispora siamensis]|uniref:Uncharacterized protein n=1 Tax=Planobispora siamensis TaxID=936338 RepID=A0A8J3WJ83_9ACTN|nr:hypothetical protein [Planobispora siamensis]GIH89596.1 hypothetical protein Psi01_02260 [Planobispora siamensis]
MTGPASLAVCDFTIENTDNVIGDEVKAVDLQEGGNGDEIFLRIGGNLFPLSGGTVQFPTAGTGRPAGAFGFVPPVRVQFTDGILAFQLIEDDLTLNDRIANVELPCGNVRTQLSFTNRAGNATYEVEFAIRVVG